MFLTFALMPIVFLTTTHIAAVLTWGSVLPLIGLIIGAGVYYPFVRLSEKLRRKKQELTLKEMTDLIIADEQNGTSTPLLNRRDRMGAMAKLLAYEIRRAAACDSVVMHYHPQMDGRGKILGAEALLRWEFAGSPVFPPLILKIAHEDNFYEELSKGIMRTVCRDTKLIVDASPNKSLLISANISTGELTRFFAAYILSLLKEYDIKEGNFGLEITETEALVDSEESLEVINTFKKKGIPLSIDDFSMGSTSLKYLQNNKFDFVKLDGNLVKSLAVNPRSADIISSITNLGKTLGFEVVAEYVENENALFKLSTLGCTVFQGWYYSRALPPDEFIEYSCEQTRN